RRLSLRRGALRVSSGSGNVGALLLHRLPACYWRRIFGRLHGGERFLQTLEGTAQGLRDHGRQRQQGDSQLLPHLRIASDEQFQRYTVIGRGGGGKSRQQEALQADDEHLRVQCSIGGKDSFRHSNLPKDARLSPLWDGPGVSFSGTGGMK